MRFASPEWMPWFEVLALTLLVRYNLGVTNNKKI